MNENHTIRNIFGFLKGGLILEFNKSNFMTKIQSIKYISIFLILLTNVLAVQGNELKQFNIEDEYFSIQPIITDFCNVEQTSVFHIVRLNYSTNPNPYYLNYIQFLDFENKLIVEKNVIKEINSYTKANTGFVQFNLSGSYDLIFNLDNLSLSWNYNVSCNEPEINQTENETTEEFQIFFNINTDKDIYVLGEKVKIYFNNVNTSKPFQISYWVEDLRGNIVKSKYTTQNTEYKSFTPSFEDLEKGFVVKATLYQEGLEKSDQKLFAFVNENYVSSNIENNIELEEVKFDYVSKTIDFEMLIEKNEGLKRIVEINGENVDGKKVCDSLKLDLLTKGKIKFYGSLYCDLNKLKEIEEVVFVVEGLNLTKHENIYLENNFFEEEKGSWKILNQSTKKQYAEGNLTWYVKVEGEGEALLILQNNNNPIIIEKVNVSGVKTFDFVFDALPNMNISARLVPFKEILNNEMALNLLLREEKKEILQSNLENFSFISSEVVKDDLITGNIILNAVDEGNLTKLGVKNVLMYASISILGIWGAYGFFFKQK
ncbi:MAG: hypothetical protein PHU51_01110 [Candidatus Nanoarchaeia archaeon]|nr:hypothetical protein [Candidatus Nanoarchaeia archaeon]